jgi:hypothetical protein
MAIQLSPGDQAKLQLMQEMEIEMMSDLYNRMTTACHKKCIPPKYSDSELGRLTYYYLWGKIVLAYTVRGVNAIRRRKIDGTTN